MANTTKRRPPAKGSPGQASRAFATSDIAGTFAYRFSGFTMKQERQWWLTGVGRFDIDAKGKLTGAHSSAIMVLKGSDAEVRKGEYSLDGTITMKGDGSGNAEILFTKTRGGGLDVRGWFSVMLGGDKDHLWFISAGAVSDSGEAAHESVTLEAVRLVL
jgi:hypothetical protein